MEPNLHRKNRKPKQGNCSTNNNGKGKTKRRRRRNIHPKPNHKKGGVKVGLKQRPKRSKRSSTKSNPEKTKTKEVKKMPTCIDCPTCQPLKGDDNKQECTEYKWTFSKELAGTQALCDGRVNTAYPKVTEDVSDTQ
jgi:hypothetical protein